MIPEDIRGSLRPELALRGEDVARVMLPCDVALKFVYEAKSKAVTWAQIGGWGVSLQAVGVVAAQNTLCWVGWEEPEAGVFLVGGTCWQEVVLHPAGFLDPGDVSGRPVIYIIDGSTAVLTGADCAAGLAYIRRAMRGGLGACALALNRDGKTWSRFYVHDATAIDLRRVTVRGHGRGEGRYVRQSSPPSHYGHVILEVAPHVGDHDYLLVWAVDEKTIPSEYREAVWEGIQGFATDYSREAGPLVGVRVTVTGGSHHDVDSKAASYRIAAGIAFRNAVMQMEMPPLDERRREQSSREQEDTRAAPEAVIPEERRLAELRRLGVSDPLLRMSEGALLHEAFRFWYTAPPLYSYSGAAPPEGPTFVPLWDHADNVVGVRELEDGPEFLEYYIEQPGRYQSLARTEQDFLTWLFVNIYENNDKMTPADLREPAELIGFRHLEAAVAACDQADHATTEAHEAFLRDLTARIDQRAQAGGAAHGAGGAE